MLRLSLVCLGGAVGSGARYLISIWAAAAVGTAFPWGTLMVNVAGSLLITLVVELSSASAAMSSDVRLFLTTGVLGGFTTYSAFNHEVIGYARSGAWGTAVVYASSTFVGCLLAGFAALAIAGALAGK